VRSWSVAGQTPPLHLNTASQLGRAAHRNEDTGQGLAKPLPLPTGARNEEDPMKRTDQERIAREIGRQQKKEAIRTRLLTSKDDVSVAGYAKALEDVFMWDDETVYNIQDDAVLEVLLEMKENLSDKDLEAALKRAIKKTGVKDRETPLAEALELLQS
jgi:hypothetical protein